MATDVIFSRRCLEYGSWHIEGPGRVSKTYERLRGSGFKFVEPEPASEQDLLKVHSHEYLQGLRAGTVEDGDTPAYEGIYEYARLAAGGAIRAARVGGFSLMRPPGHHVGIGGCALGVGTRGFCYLNNVAVAVEYLNRPTLILDIDGHHGNGTQEIFAGRENVAYVSLHRHPCYPGTGYVSSGNCLNFPLPGDCGEEIYLRTLDGALDAVEPERFKVVAVSAGFDTYEGDLASLGLTEGSYRGIGRRIAAMNMPTFFVLEGGYCGENLGRGIAALLEGFGG